MKVGKIDCGNTNELRELILQRPELPILVVTDCDVICGDGWWYGGSYKYAIMRLIKIEKDNGNVVLDKESDLYEYIQAELSDSYKHPEYKVLSDKQFDELVNAKVKEYELLWTECIVILSDV